MITIQEVSALAQILKRAPLTQAEGLWLQGFIDKLTVMAQLQEQSEKKAMHQGEPSEQEEVKDAS